MIKPRRQANPDLPEINTENQTLCYKGTHGTPSIWYNKEREIFRDSHGQTHRFQRKNSQLTLDLTKPDGTTIQEFGVATLMEYNPRTKQTQSLPDDKPLKNLMVRCAAIQRKDHNQKTDTPKKTLIPAYMAYLKQQQAQAIIQKPEKPELTRYYTQLGYTRHGNFMKHNLKTNI